jgi:phosphate starvation-inducible PhoH-like protein
VADEMGLGKALSANTLIITPFGKKRIGDMKCGDKVIGSNGKPTTVIGVYPQPYK